MVIELLQNKFFKFLKSLRFMIGKYNGSTSLHKRDGYGRYSGRQDFVYAWFVCEMVM